MASAVSDKTEIKIGMTGNITRFQTDERGETGSKHQEMKRAQEITVLQHAWFIMYN